jgi:hypothetical protein
VVTLNANALASVRFTVSSKSCSGFTPVNATEDVFCNLKTGQDGDSDLGQTTGPCQRIPNIFLHLHFLQTNSLIFSGAKFAAASVGQQFTIPVRVRAVGKAMLAFQFRLQFPSSLTALSYSVGADFVGSFACTLNSPPTLVLIVGSDPDGVSGPMCKSPQ